MRIPSRDVITGLRTSQMGEPSLPSRQPNAPYRERQNLLQILSPHCWSGETPIATSGLSPDPLMFGRRTRTPLPTASHLLSTPTAPAETTAALNASEKQAQYYKGTHECAPLNVGQAARIRFAGDIWRKAHVIEQLQHRSHNGQLQDGTVRGRNSHHTRSTNEPPIVIKTEPPELEDENTASYMQHYATAEAPSPWGTGTLTTSVRPREILRTTRSGRVVKRPVRFS